jgi:anti-sigma factor RsiW
MNETFQCGDNAALVGYLYDEGGPDERRAIEAHLAVCAACTAEVAALRSTRLSLSSWTPPDADLNFRIVSDAAPAKGLRPAPGPRSWWTQPLPAWAQAAAAVVLFGAGLALGVTQGIGPEAPPAATTVASAPATSANTVSADDLAAVERRLRAEMAQLRTASTASAAAVPAQAPALSAVEGQVLARVRALIDESEQRQQRELALRMTQVMRDVDTQRRMDLAQIQGSFRQIEGVTGAQVREQRDMMNYLIRASQQAR